MARGYNTIKSVTRLAVVKESLSGVVSLRERSNLGGHVPVGTDIAETGTHPGSDPRKALPAKPTGTVLRPLAMAGHATVH